MNLTGAQFVKNKGLEENNFFTRSTDHSTKLFIFSTPTTGISEYITGSGTTTGVNHTIPNSAINDNFVMSTRSTATQATSNTTGVTLNGSSGVITMFANVTAAGGALSGTFTVTNSTVTTASIILLQIVNYSGTYGANGIPDVRVGVVAAGSFDVVVMNAHSANALAGKLKIAFQVS
jgi:hypothetical protein